MLVLENNSLDEDQRQSSSQSVIKWQLFSPPLRPRVLWSTHQVMQRYKWVFGDHPKDTVVQPAARLHRSLFWRRLEFTGCQDTGQPASWCLANSEILEKVLKQLAHWYFFTSEWVWRWARRLDRSAKARLQWRHENGFSPVEDTQTHVSDMLMTGGCILLFLSMNPLNNHNPIQTNTVTGYKTREVRFEACSVNMDRL